MKLLAAFIIGFGVAMFQYWVGGGDFARGEELRDYCAAGMALGAVAAISAWIFDGVDAINKEDSK